MLNHYRTLLANIEAGALDGVTGFAEEPVPSDFVPVNLSSPLQQVRRVLFGTSPDRAFVNYRTRQIMMVLRESPYAEYLTYHDARVCYRDNYFNVIPKQITAYAHNNGHLSTFGSLAGQDAAGLMQFDYMVTVLAGSNVRVQRIRPAGVTVEYAFSLNSEQVSASLSLPGSGHNFRLHSPVEGDTWDVSLLLYPSKDLGSLVASLDFVGEDVLQALFGSQPAEPYLTFYNLWTMSRSMPDRLMGVVSALVFRTHDLIGK